MTGNENNTKGNQMNANEIVEIVKARPHSTVRDICNAAGLVGLKAQGAVRRKLAAMVKAGQLTATKVKAWHRVDNQHFFGGAAVGAHYENRYTA